MSAGPDFGDCPIDQAIVRVLEVQAELALRARLRADAERARNDADDVAEIRRVHAEFDEISAW